MRRPWRLFGLALGGLLLLVIAYLTLLFFPGVLFAKQIQHGNFTVHSQTELHEGLTTVLQEVEAALATSAINNPTLRHDILPPCMAKKVSRPVRNREAPATESELA